MRSLPWCAYLLHIIRRKKAVQAALEYQLSLRQMLSNSIPLYITTLKGELGSYNNAFSAFFTLVFQENMRFTLFDRRNPLVDISPLFNMNCKMDILQIK